MWILLPRLPADHSVAAEHADQKTPASYLRVSRLTRQRCTVVATATGTVPTAGNWSATFTGSAGAAGEPITIRLLSTGRQSAFDDVRLTPVPEPSFIGVVGIGLVGLLVFARRNRLRLRDIDFPDPGPPLDFNLRAGWAHTPSCTPFATDHTRIAARRDLFRAAADAAGGLSFPATTYPTSTPNPNGINPMGGFP